MYRDMRISYINSISYRRTLISISIIIVSALALVGL